VRNLTLIDPVTVSNEGLGVMDVSSNVECAKVYHQNDSVYFKNSTGWFNGNMGREASNVTNIPVPNSNHSLIPYDALGIPRPR